MKKVLPVIAMTLVLAACVNLYKQNYQSSIDSQAATHLQLLAEGATPIVMKTEDMEAAIAKAKADGYVEVGQASFNNELQSIDNLVDQAKAVRATMVLYTNKYTDTQTVTSTSYVPIDTTTITAGRYDGKRYEETSTSSRMVPVPTVTQVRNFDQRAVFFAKSKR